SLFVALHSACGITSISANILLLVCMFRHTPASFANFGLLLKAHVLTDLYQAVGAAMCMIREGLIIAYSKSCVYSRIIPIGQAIVYISYGPCYIAGPTVCYAFYMIQVGAANCTLYTTLASFIYRLLMLRNKTMTRQHAALLIVCVALPIPTIITVVL
ncbi:hypothetical protein PFISCL1PPCAC_13801, partial [Pristionchus fissidentatus]